MSALKQREPGCTGLAAGTRQLETGRQAPVSSCSHTLIPLSVTETQRLRLKEASVTPRQTRDGNMRFHMPQREKQTHINDKKGEGRRSASHPQAAKALGRGRAELSSNLCDVPETHMV